MARRVTYSRNITLSLSRSCQCVCKYCAFATRKPHLRTPQEVERLIEGAARRGVKELLVLTGEAPETVTGVSEQLAEWGHASFLDYVVWACERGLGAGMLPHTNLGVLEREELARLREVTASQGLMLESISERLMDTVHAGSPTKHPARRLATIRAAGELQIPFTSGILVGIGETREERIASLAALGEVQRAHGHLQEVIIQNFVPHRRYYGEDTGAVATEAAERYWRTGLGTPPELAAPAWASEVTIDDLVELIGAARELVPGAAVQVPPNLSDFWPELVRAGATDLGGLSSNGDHISPEHPFPSPKQVRDRLAPDGVSIAERLCAHERFLTPEWIAEPVMDLVRTRYWSFLPWTERSGGEAGSGGAGSGDAGLGGAGSEQVDGSRAGSDRAAGDGAAGGRASARPGISGAVEAIARAAGGEPLSHAELTALLDDRRPEVVEDVRQAADALRESLCGDVVTFVVNRNLNLTNVCTVGCAFCGFGQSRRSPDAYTLDESQVRERIAEAVSDGATELCVQSGIHPDWTADTYLDWLRLAKAVAPQIHLHAFSPMELDAMIEHSGLAPIELFARLRAAGIGSIPGTAAEILDDEIRNVISPNKLPTRRWVELIGAAHAAGIPTTSTVMFGHVEQARHLATHLEVVRALAERSTAARVVAGRALGASDAALSAFSGDGLPARITEFVPLRFIPHQTLLGRTKGVRELDADETLRLTAVFRLGLGRSIPNLQTSWVKLGLDLATESLRWGVNDLGGTLMEENISRLAGADHGVRLDPPELIAAAHAAGRPAAERSTLYAVRQHHPPPVPV